MSSHGPHFDEFHASPTHGHGGAEFDEFHGGPTANAGGKGTGESSNLHDHTSTTGSHGEHWDEFGWRELPMDHGYSMDSNFRAPAALDGDHGHGTWFDVFRGGTQVKAIAEGHDIEATVVNVRDDHAVVRTRDGRDLELGLQQLRAFRHIESVGAPSETRKPTAHVETGDGVAPASSAHAPSAHDAKARGGQRRSLQVGDTGSKAPLNKTADDVDVAKAFRSCASCGTAHTVGGQGTVQIGGGKRDPKITSFCSTACHDKGVSKTNDQVDVAKIACESCGGAPAAHQSSNGEKVCKPCMKSNLSHGYDHVGEPGESREQHIAAGLSSSALHKTDDEDDVAKADKSPLERAQWHQQRGENAMAKSYRVPSRSPEHVEHLATAAHHYQQAARHYSFHATGGFGAITHSDGMRGPKVPLAGKTDDQVVDVAKTLGVLRQLVADAG